MSDGEGSRGTFALEAPFPSELISQLSQESFSMRCEVLCVCVCEREREREWLIWTSERILSGNCDSNTVVRKALLGMEIKYEI